MPVSRQETDIVDAPALFYLRNTRRFAPNYFGYRYFSLLPSRYLRKEIAIVESLLPRLFAAFEQRVLLDEARWPELDDFLGLMHERSRYFDAAKSPG